MCRMTSIGSELCIVTCVDAQKFPMGVLQTSAFSRAIVLTVVCSGVSFNAIITKQFRRPVKPALSNSCLQPSLRG